VLKPALESKENIIGSVGPIQPIQNQSEAPHVSSEEELSHIDEDSQSNCSDLKTPTQGIS